MIRLYKDPLKKREHENKTEGNWGKEGRSLPFSRHRHLLPRSPAYIFAYLTLTCNSYYLREGTGYLSTRVRIFLILSTIFTRIGLPSTRKQWIYTKTTSFRNRSPERFKAQSTPIRVKICPLNWTSWFVWIWPEFCVILWISYESLTR